MPYALEREPTVKITHRKEEDVPTSPAATSRVSATVKAIMDELNRVAPGMVMVIEMGQGDSIRATKAAVTRAGNELGTPVQHWHRGREVYARPVRANPMGIDRPERSARGDHRD
jgi:hypothetical protein